MTLPDLYILGAPKAGTTSLSRWLASHPDVYFSRPKEPVFWATDYPRLRTARGFDTRRSYDRLFSSDEARAAVVRAEGSTVYLYSHEAVPNVMEAQGGRARFVVALRNPADLVVSYHRTQQLLLNEDGSEFAAAWARSLTGTLPDAPTLDPKLVDYPRVGALGEAVRRLLETVPREQTHFVVFEQLRDSPGQVWSALTDFVGLPEEPRPEFAVHNPSTRTFRSARLQRFRARPPALLAKPVRMLRHASLRSSNARLRRLKRSVWWREQPKPTVPPETRAMLTDHFAADVLLLEELVGIDLSAWRPGTRPE